MSLVAGRVCVATPASSANLGPGFDALGLALSMHDRLTAGPVDGAPAGSVEVVVHGEGAGDLPLDRDHLVIRAMDATFRWLEVDPPGLRVVCENVIPHARGLGSSSAAIVGGIVLARALVEDGPRRLDDAAALRLASDLEGHPDNVAAALLGGLTIAWLEDGTAAAQRLDVAASVTVVVPPDPVSTEAARGLLPERVTHAEAAANAGRAALLVAALTQAPERLLPATEDFLHQRHRAAVMPDSIALVDRLRRDGVPAVVSGAGPSVLAFGRGLVDVPEGWAVHELDVTSVGAHLVDV